MPAQGSSTLLPQTVDLLETYRGLVALGRINFDEDQVRVVLELRKLHKELADYAPPALTSHYLDYRLSKTISDDESEPWWSSTAPEDLVKKIDTKALVRVRNHAEDLAELTTPKGLLLTGPPGSGKSFLVDLWFDSLPTRYKARKHYSQLVLEVYRAVWIETQRRMASRYQAESPLPTTPQPWNKAVRARWRELIASGSLPMKWVRKPSMMFSAWSASYDQTIAFVVAQRLILRHWLLVFDEVQLLDVSSATLLADVLSWFWRMGGVIVGTSNKVPDDLYRNGVQRERLEPFVEAMKVRCPVVVMRTQQDWREVRALSSSSRTWYTIERQADFERKLAELRDSESIAAAEQPSARTLTVFGRSVHVPWAKGGICQFSFEELCEESMGSADYLTIASSFHTVVITSIPVLKLSAKNQARRFISLIDALYEARCRIVCLAEAEADALFFPDAVVADSPTDVDVLLAEAVGETRDVYRPNVSSYDAPNMAEAPAAPRPAVALEALSMFSGKEEQFAYKRALSRLREMTSEGYAKQERWTPLPADERKWERPSSVGAVPRGRAAAASAPATPKAGNDPDFAEEAAYDRGHFDPRQRPEAPRLRDEHIWGVRDDWGERANAWGRGAKAHEPPSRGDS